MQFSGDFFAASIMGGFSAAVWDGKSRPENGCYVGLTVVKREDARNEITRAARQQKLVGDCSLSA